MLVVGVSMLVPRLILRGLRYAADAGVVAHHLPVRGAGLGHLRRRLHQGVLPVLRVPAKSVWTGIRI